MEQPITITSEMLRQLTRIADSLERLANGGEPTAPDMRRPIEEYKTFDWSTIGACVVKEDNDGPTMVEYAGTLWTRRSPVNKFEPAIWFSRAAGKNTDGEVTYMRLITFQTIRDADPLPKKAEELVNKPTIAHPGELTKPAQEPAKVVAETAVSIYVKFATSAKFNLPQETALWLLKKVGENTEKAKELVPYVAEGKAAGLDGKTLGDILHQAKLNPQEFMVLVRNRIKEQQLPL